MNELAFFNPNKDVAVTQHRLPHWQQGSCACSITFRLADALPHHLLEAWGYERTAWMQHHPKPWTDEVEQEYHHRFTARIQKWLDAGHGCCVLREPRLAAIVAERLQTNRVGAGHTTWSFVVMPNHVHVLVSGDEDCELPRLIRLWKGGSAREINLTLGSTGRLWQPDYFDRLIRTPHHFGRCLDYIRENPVKAKLSKDAFLHWERPLARDLLNDYVTKHGAI